MLTQIIEQNNYCFHKHFETWQEAIKASCEPFEKNGVVDERYAQLIIECVEKYGPYIVLTPMVAMPHSQENAEGVMKTAVSFMRVEDPVHFDENDSAKDAKIFFTIASQDHDQHIQNLMKLSEMLVNEELIKELLEVKDVHELKTLAQKYNL